MSLDYEVIDHKSHGDILYIMCWYTMKSHGDILYNHRRRSQGAGMSYSLPPSQYLLCIKELTVVKD